MAIYKYLNHLHHYNGTGVEEFDKLYEPGTKSAWSGIYRCKAGTPSFFIVLAQTPA
jgi:hypothetical protein